MYYFPNFWISADACVRRLKSVTSLETFLHHWLSCRWRLFAFDDVRLYYCCYGDDDGDDDDGYGSVYLHWNLSLVTRRQLMSPMRSRQTRQMYCSFLRFPSTEGIAEMMAVKWRIQRSAVVYCNCSSAEWIKGEKNFNGNSSSYSENTIPTSSNISISRKRGSRAVQLV